MVFIISSSIFHMATNVSTTKLSSFIIHSLFFLAFSPPLWGSRGKEGKIVFRLKRARKKTRFARTKLPKNLSKWKVISTKIAILLLRLPSFDFDLVSDIFIWINPKGERTEESWLGNDVTQMESIALRQRNLKMRLNSVLFPVCEPRHRRQTINNPINFNFSFNCFPS